MGESSRNSPRRRRWRRAFLVFFLLLVLATTTLWLLAKNYGTEFLETVLTGALDQPVRIDELIVDPWAGEFGAAGFVIAKGTQTDALTVQLGKGLVTVRMSRLWPPALVASVAVTDLDIELDAVPGTAAEESQPVEFALPSSFEFGPLTLRLESVRLDGGGFVYRDPPADIEIGIRDIDAGLEPSGKGFAAEVSVNALRLRFPGVSESLEQLRLNGALDPERIGIEQLTLRYEGEPLEIKGTVLDPFNELALDLEVEGKLPLERLDHYLQAPEWAFSGLLQLDGWVRGPIPALNAAWTARVPELAAGELSAREVVVEGRWDSRTLRISRLAAELFGGSLQASLEMVPADLSETRAQLSLTQVALGSLQDLLEESVDLQGTADLEAEAVGDPGKLEQLRARVEVNAREVVLPGDAAALGPGGVALAGSLEDGLVNLSKLNARWQAAELGASGNASVAGSFDVSAKLDANMKQVAQAFRLKGFDGKAVFDAALQGDWQQLRADGELRGELVSTSGSEIGRLELPFRVQEQKLRIPKAVVSVGRTRLDGSIEAAWGPELRFEGRLEAAPVRMEDLAIFMPADLEATGGFNLSAEGRGNEAMWQASGRLHAEELSVAGVFLDDLAVALSANQQALRVERFGLSLNRVPVSGEGRWAWSGAGNGKLVLGPTELAKVRGIPPDAGLRGTARAAVEGSMEGGAINARGELVLANAAVDELSLGDGRLGFTVNDSRLAAELGFPGLNLSGSAEGNLAPGGNVAVELALAQFELAPVLEAFAPDASETLSGEITASAKARVPFDDPMKVLGSVRIDPLRLRVAGEGLRNEGPILIEAEDGSLRLAQFALSSTGGGRLSAAGTLTRFEDVDFETKGSVPLELLAGLTPEITQAGGVLELDTRVQGRLEKPVISGGGRIRNGSVAFASYPDAVREIEATFAFTPKGAQVERLTALLGRGQISGSGELGLEGFDIGAYQAKLTLRELPVAPIDGLRTTWNVDLELLGFEDRGIIQGEANLLRGTYSRELSILSLLFEQRPSSAAGGGGEPPAFDLVLRVRVNLNDNFLVRTPLARLRVGGSVTVEGPVTDPVVFGSVAVRDGYLTFQRRRFDLSRAVVNFANPRQIDPMLDIEAKSAIRQYDVTLQVTGRPEDLTITLSSDPSLPEEDLLSLVAFGVTREQFGRSAPGVLAGQAAQLIADDLFGGGSVLDGIDVDMQGEDGSTMTVGARLGEDTTVSFARGAGADGKQRIRIEHQLFGPLLIAGGRDLEGGFETDIVLRFRFR